MKVEIRSLVAKVDKADNNSLREIQDLASERNIKYFKKLLASK